MCGLEGLGVVHHDHETGILQLKKDSPSEGCYTRSLTFGGRIIRFFQRAELLEKIAELFDEALHLSMPILQPKVNPLLYRYFCGLHEAAHTMEHSLHALCFLGSASRWAVDYREGRSTSSSLLAKTARLVHVAGHLVSTLNFFSELGLISNPLIKMTFKHRPSLNAMGYALSTLFLLGERYRNQKNSRFTSDFCICFNGALFEGVPVLVKMAQLAPSDYAADKITSLAGLIHAWFMVQRLWPKDEMKVNISLDKGKDL